ncbi:hypothetical protein DSUL_100022 [Desulfovibrionales bacterium]
MVPHIQVFLFFINGMPANLQSYLRLAVIEPNMKFPDNVNLKIQIEKRNHGPRKGRVNLPDKTIKLNLIHLTCRSIPVLLTPNLSQIVGCLNDLMRTHPPGFLVHDYGSKKFRTWMKTSGYLLRFTRHLNIEFIERN